MDTSTFILGILGSNLVAVWITLLAARRRDQADIEKTEAETAQISGDEQRDSETYYRMRVEETIKQMVALENQVRELKTTIELAKVEYERRVGSLHNKIDTLTDELNRANVALKLANETIIELRQEVKDGFVTISDLKQTISELLIQKAKDEKAGYETD